MKIAKTTIFKNKNKNMDVVIDLVSKKMLLVISPNERELERI